MFSDAEIGAIVRAQRIAIGWNQVELLKFANSVGIDLKYPSQISLIECGKRRLLASEYSRLAIRLGLPSLTDPISDDQLRELAHLREFKDRVTKAVQS